MLALTPGTLEPAQRHALGPRTPLPRLGQPAAEWARESVAGFWVLQLGEKAEHRARAPRAPRLAPDASPHSRALPSAHPLRLRQHLGCGGGGGGG
eukprot:3941723-Rhodomonas_salina.6